MNRKMMTSTIAAKAVVVAAALAGSLAAAHAAGAEKDKCFGISKAGQNDCASVVGTHSCAGQAKIDYDRNEWKYVSHGTCQAKGGTTAMPKGAK